MAGIAGILDTSMLSSKNQLISLARAMADQAPVAGTLRTEAVADETTGFVLAAAGIAAADDSAHLTALARSASGRFLVAMTGTNSPLRKLRTVIDRNDRAIPSAAVIATAIEQIGPAETLGLVDGPFAFAILDQAERTLTLGRDRYGQESLFVAWAGSSFIFGSHLFSLVTHPNFRREIDRGAVAQYLRYSHFQSPHTVFTQAVRVKPGSLVTMHASQPGAEIVQTMSPILEEARFGIANQFTGNATAAADALESALQTAFHEAMADTTSPIGIFFSGGLDSTLLAATAASIGDRPVHAITAGFDAAAYDESGHARQIARHLNVEHHVVQITANDMRDLMPLAAETYQEPFGDTAGLPAMRLAQVARDLAPLIVTGDGGDELLLGKPSNMLWEARKWFPGPSRPLTAHALDLMARGAERSRRLVDRFVPGSVAQYLRPSRIRKAAAGMHAATAEAGMGALYSDSLDPRSFLLNPRNEPSDYYADSSQWLPSEDQDERWRYIGVVGYTFDREIPKHQRAITASGAAFRSMLFNPGVAELAWSLPAGIRDNGGVPRGLLRDIIARYVPLSVFDRPKAGFDVPFDLWFRGALRDIVEEAFDPRRLREEGLFNVDAIHREWNQHLTGKHDRRYILYDLIAFQLWYAAMNRVPVAK
jgi:asparagine synthase (glutamine-hydrolysing)